LSGTILKEFLATKYINYQSLIHPRSFTAKETASNAQVSRKKVAKTVVIKVDGKLAIAVLAAPHKVLFDKLRREVGAKTLTLATEQELRQHFSDCEIGAMPPFGCLYGMETYLDHRLVENNEIYFTGGSHQELVKMSIEDYITSAWPLIAQFSSRMTARSLF